jgi:hypothetical protein
LDVKDVATHDHDQSAAAKCILLPVVGVFVGLVDGNVVGLNGGELFGLVDG